MDQPFNLPAPPGFVGFDEQRPVRIYHRHLPHWRQDGASYAVTFRLGDSLPQSKLQELKRHRARWEQAHPDPRSNEQWKSLAQQISQMTERCLDEGYGACYFRNPENAKRAADTLRFFEETKCNVPCLIIMPNHIHAVMSPLAGYELESILKSMKGWIAKQINARNTATGSLWAQESYDRIIRDEEHLYRVVQYIGRNAATARLPPHEYLRRIAPTWQAAGWDFQAT